MNNEFSLAPLFRHTVGFDRFNEVLDNALRSDQGSGFPPYDIIREGNEDYRIVMAVAGFSEEEIDIVLRENQLTVTGKHKPQEKAEEITWLHRGIARRNFERHFRLADHVQVKSANLNDGLLEIHLQRIVPETQRPQVIPIEVGNKA